MLKKKYSLILVIALAFVFLPGLISRAQTQANQSEKIISFSSNLETRTDASVNLVETIVYDFGQNQRHGIFRTIRIKNADNKNMDVSVTGVYDEKGQQYPYTISKSSKDVTVKIGDPNNTITGIHTYVLSFNITNVATYFENKDEFTWNVIGTDWPVPILHASASVTVPDAVNEADITYSCYRGAYGSTNSCISKRQDGKTIMFSDDNFVPGEDFTVSVGIPKGIIVPAQEKADYSEVIKIIIAILLPIGTLIGMLIFRRKKGGAKDTTTIIPEYAPPSGFKPTLVGAAVDGSVDDKDITAGIISTAQEGFLKITRIEKQTFFGKADYELELLKPITDLLEKTEQSILKCFFIEGRAGEKVLLSSFKRSRALVSAIDKIKTNIDEDMVARGFFTTSPKKLKQVIWIPFIVATVIETSLGQMFGSYIGMGVLASTLVVLLVGLSIKPTTELGKNIRRQILGFKQFLTVTDKDRMDFHNAPEKNPQQFMEYLPYAIALGVEEKWAKQFEGIYLTPPNWYAGANTANFTAASFVHDMSVFTAYSNSISSPQSSGASGGGGFSGGGGGGGGGGSW